MSHLDPFEFKQVLYLGGRISHKDKLFKMLAKLGYDEAEKYALVEFWIWFNEHPKASVEDTIKKALELKGMATMLRHTKELTRLSMILGDTREEKTYERRHTKNISAKQ